MTDCRAIDWSRRKVGGLTQLNSLARRNYVGQTNNQIRLRPQHEEGLLPGNDVCRVERKILEIVVRSMTTHKIERWFPRSGINWRGCLIWFGRGWECKKNTNKGKGRVALTVLFGGHSQFLFWRQIVKRIDATFMIIKNTGVNFNNILTPTNITSLT